MIEDMAGNLSTTPRGYPGTLGARESARRVQLARAKHRLNVEVAGDPALQPLQLSAHHVHSGVKILSYRRRVATEAEKIECEILDIRNKWRKRAAKQSQGLPKTSEICQCRWQDAVAGFGGGTESGRDERAVEASTVPGLQNHSERTCRFNTRIGDIMPSAAAESDLGHEAASHNSARYFVATLQKGVWPEGATGSPLILSGSKLVSAGVKVICWCPAASLPPRCQLLCKRAHARETVQTDRLKGEIPAFREPKLRLPLLSRLSRLCCWRSTTNRLDRLSNEARQAAQLQPVKLHQPKLDTVCKQVANLEEALDQMSSPSHIAYAHKEAHLG